MKILIISRIDDQDALAYTSSLAGSLREMGHDVQFEKSTAEYLGVDGVSADDAGADLVVVVGGDGSVLLTVQRMKRQVPLLGINWGEVGFLTSIEPEEALPFFSTCGDGFSVESRMRISLLDNGRVIGTALNEALIVTRRPAKMLRFSIAVDGEVTEEFRADGLLVSTPTGSTAYAMSAGGPIVDPRIEGFLIVPLAPFMLSSRPHFISCDRTLEIHLEDTKPAQLVIDGQRTLNLGKEAGIEIRKSDDPALFVDTGANFFRKVDSKLRRL